MSYVMPTESQILVAPAAAHEALPASRPARWAAVFVGASLLAIVALNAAAHLSIADPVLRRAAMIAGTCLVLWLTELTPLYATTLLLWAGVVLLLGPLDPKAFALP